MRNSRILTFEVTNNISYKKYVKQTVLEFKITDSLEEWEDTMIDRKVECCYMLRTPDDLTEKIIFSDKHFLMHNLFLDEEKLVVEKKFDEHGRIYYSAHVPERLRHPQKLTEVKYIFKALIKKAKSSLLAMGPVVPTKGIRINLNFAGDEDQAVGIDSFLLLSEQARFCKCPGHPSRRKRSHRGRMGIAAKWGCFRLVPR